MERYLVFANEAYYPDGGWQDFKLATDSLQEAKETADKYVKECRMSAWAHVVDTVTTSIIYEKN